MHVVIVVVSTCFQKGSTIRIRSVAVFVPPKYTRIYVKFPILVLFLFEVQVEETLVYNVTFVPRSITVNRGSSLGTYMSRTDDHEIEENGKGGCKRNYPVILSRS